MTEEEAKTKICPQTLPVGSPGMPCIASACMAWRKPAKRSTFGFMGGHHQGYCGLAGKP